MIWKKTLIAQFSTVPSPMAALSLTCLLEEKHSFTCLLKFLVIAVVLRCTVLQQIQLTSRQLRKEKISLTDLVTTSVVRKSNWTVNWWCVVPFNIWLSVDSLLLFLVKTKTKYQTVLHLQREIRKCKRVPCEICGKLSHCSTLAVPHTGAKRLGCVSMKTSRVTRSWAAPLRGTWRKWCSCTPAPAVPEPARALTHKLLHSL